MRFDFEALPVRMDRTVAAAFITRHYFPVARRSLERWPLEEVYVNGRVMLKTRQLVAEAERRLAQTSPPPDPRNRRLAVNPSTAT